MGAERTSSRSGAAAKHLAAGAIAGGCEILVTIPLDVIKTQMQINPTRYASILDATRKIVSERGVAGLYYGLPAFLAQVGGKVGIRFAAFGVYSDALRARDGTLSTGASAVAGLGAGVTEAVLWTTPTERMKVLRMSQIGSGREAPFRGLVGGVQWVVANQGVRGLYRGVSATVMRQGSSMAIRFGLFATIKRALERRGDGSPQWWHALAGGAAVGGISAFVNNPIDVVKSRMQSQESSGVKYRNTLDCARSVLANDGVGAFFKGVRPRILRVGLGQCVTFFVYEHVSAFLGA